MARRPRHWLDRKDSPSLIRLVFGRASVPAQDPLEEYNPSRHPFQTLLMLACMIGGIGNLISSGSPAIDDTLPKGVAVLWGVTMFIGGFMALTGAYGRDRITGLLLERTAMMLIGVSCGGYAACLFSFSGIQAIASGPLILLTGIASVWRMRQVVKELRKLRQFMSMRIQAELGTRAEVTDGGDA